MDLGINLSPVNDWNREWVFSNIFLQSREWRLIKNGVVQPPTVRVPILANGYPDFTQITAGDKVQSLMLIDQGGHYPKGIYNASWSGDLAGVTFSGPGVTMGTVTDDFGVFKVDVDVQGDNGITLILDHANVTGISVLMPGNNGALHPTFLSPLYHFKHIRFLNWMNTNTVNTPYIWENRTTPSHARQSYQPQGVALEAMIYLCNKTKTRPWFCMPHLFDDNYVRKFATMVKNNCAADKIYIEFSNETWNLDFPVQTWAKAESVRLGIPWPYVVADAAKHMWDIWISVFGDKVDKLVRVVGG